MLWNSYQKCIAAEIAELASSAPPATLRQREPREAPTHCDPRRTALGRHRRLHLGDRPHGAGRQAKPVISEEASAALLRMGQSLRAEQFSFQARTIRVYAETGGDLLHIFHTMKVVVRRPNRLLAESIGDDGSTKI